MMINYKKYIRLFCGFICLLCVAILAGLILYEIWSPLTGADKQLSEKIMATSLVILVIFGSGWLWNIMDVD